MRPPINAALIDDLRQRLVAHNESHPAKVKLGELKKIYERGYRGQQPARRAMQRVEAHLMNKASGFDESDHPRSDTGEFSSASGGVPMAHSQAEHDALRAASPTYAAMTSDTIPERRGQFIGSSVRAGASLMAGGALIAGLLRGRPKGGTANFLRWLPGKVSRYSFAVPTAAATYGVASTYDAAKMAAARILGTTFPPVSYARPAAATATMGDFGERLGRQLGGGAFNTASRAAKTIVSAAGGDETRWKALAASGAMGLAAGAEINREVRGTIVDPEQYGSNYDLLAYRNIAKAALSDEMGDARDQMFNALRKGMNVNELRKVGAWSSFARIALPGLAGVAGAAVAGTAAHLSMDGADHGNPYRDEHGRFTSKAAAVGGSALVGAALAAGGVLLALRHHDVKLLTRVVLRNRSALTRSLKTVDAEDIKAALSGRDGHYQHLHSRIRAALKAKPAAIKTILDAGEGRPIEDLAAHRADAALYGAGANPGHYKEAVLQDISQHISERASNHGDFSFTHNGKPTTVAILRNSLTTSSIQGAIRKAVHGMDGKAISKSVAGLPLKDANYIRDLHISRDAKMNEIDAKLQNYTATVKEAGKVEERARAVHDFTQQKLADTQTAALAAPESAPATNALKAAKKAEGVASTARDAAQQSLVGLRVAGPEITLKDGTKIGPKNFLDAGETERALSVAATKYASDKVDKTIVTLGATLRNEMPKKYNRLVTAWLVRLGIKLPGAPTELADQIAAHAATGQLLESKLTAAVSAQSVAPKGADRIAATADRKTAAEAFAAHRASGLVLGDRVASMLSSEPVTVPNRFISDMKRDVGRAVGPIGDLLSSPTVANVTTFAGDAARSIAAGAESHAVSAYRDLFMVQEPGGGYAHSFGKIVQNGKYLAVGAGVVGAAAEYAREMYANAMQHGAIEGYNKTRPFTAVQIEAPPVDPITGEGFFGLSVEDPHNKGERVLIYGQRGTRTNNGPLTYQPLYAGSRVSGVKRSVEEAKFKTLNNNGNNNQQESRDAPGLDGQVKGRINETLKKMREEKNSQRIDGSDAGIIYLRNNAATQHDKSAGEMFAHIQSQIKNGQTENAMHSIFSAQGSVLTANQASELLTGSKKGGQNGSDKAILVTAPFKTQDREDIVKGLGQSIDARAQKARENPQSRMALHKIVAIVGSVRGLDQNDIAALHAKIKALGGTAPNPPAEETVAPPPVVEPVAKVNLNQAYPARPTLDMAALQAHAADKVDAVAKSLNAPNVNKLDLADAMVGLSVMAHRAGKEANVNLDFQQSHYIAHKAVIGMAGHEPENKATVLDLALTDDEAFKTEIERQLSAALSNSRIKKAVLLDDLGALMKSVTGELFSEAAHTRLPSGPGGGEFSGMSGGQRVVQEGSEAVMNSNQRADKASKTSGGKDKPQAWHEPVRLGSEAGASLGQETGAFAGAALAGGLRRGLVGRALSSAAGAAGDMAERQGFGSVLEAGARTVARVPYVGKAIRGVGLSLAMRAGLESTTIANILGRSVGGVGGFALSTGAGLLGGAIGGAYGGAGGEALGRSVTGKGGPKYAVSPEYHSVGEMVSEFGGSMGGQVLGANVGGTAGQLAGASIGATLGSVVPVLGTAAGGIAGAAIGRVGGTLIGGAIGGFAGSLSARSAHNWFTGQDTATVSRVMRKYGAKAAAT